MLRNTYITAVAIFMAMIMHGAADEKKVQPEDCFDQQRIIVPGKKLFYEPIFVQNEGARSSWDYHRMSGLNILVAMVSGPDEELVKIVAQKARERRLVIPNSRSNVDSTCGKQFLQAIFQEVLGTDVQRIPSAKQTAIAISREYASLPNDIYVPAGLSELKDDLDYCEASDEGLLGRFKMFKEYAAHLVADLPESAERHEALVLVPNHEVLREYERSRNK